MIVNREGVFWRNGGGIGWEGVALFGAIAFALFLFDHRWWPGFVVLAFIPLVIAMAAFQKAAGIPFQSERFDAARYRQELEALLDHPMFQGEGVIPKANVRFVIAAALNQIQPDSGAHRKEPS